MLGVMLGVALMSASWDWGSIRAALGRIGPGLVLALLALSIVNFALRAGRWHAFSRALGLRVSWFDSSACFLAGFAMGVTPGRVGEVIRLWLLRQRHGVRYDRAMPLLLADRVSDLLAVAIIAAVSASAAGSADKAGVLAALAIVGTAGLVLRHPDWLRAGLVRLYGCVGRGGRFFASASRALRNGREIFSARATVLAATLGVAAWLAEGVAFFLLLDALQSGLSLQFAVFVYVFATLVGALTFLPGGLGGFEATAVFLLHRAGLDLGTATLATAVIRIATLWFSVALGSAVLVWMLSTREGLDG